MDWNKAKEVLERYRSQLLAIDGVIGVSTGVYEFDQGPEACIFIYLASWENSGRELSETLPSELEGVKVIIEVSGKFYFLGN